MSKIASKTAKRLSPASGRPKRGRPTALAAARDAAAAAEVIEGHVTDVGEPGFVRAELATGETVQALCPAHVDAAWLKEACARAPVAAVFARARPSGRHVLWGIFPGVAHADVRADVVIRGRAVKVDAEALQLNSRAAHLDLDPEGNVALKGRDVTSHARRVNRIKGGSIRLN
jgi:hypothetical protein